MKIRGKNFTVPQRKTLLKNGISHAEIDQYLMKKIKVVSSQGKSLNQYDDKTESWIIIHKETGELREVVIS